jgi:adenine-specific DNA-methyltransferase
VTPADISRWLYDAGHAQVAMLAFDSKRYVGAQIGIYDPNGRRVGRVSHLRNTEYVFVAGPADLVGDAVRSAGG